MAAYTYGPGTPTKPCSSLLRDANATPDSPDLTPVMVDDAPLPCQPLNSNNRMVVLQSNHIAEGVTINIFSSNCNGSIVNKLEHVTPTVQPTTLEPPSVRRLAPVELSPDSVVFNNNTLCEHVMINIGSPNCTGAIKQIVFKPQTNHN